MSKINYTILLTFIVLLGCSKNKYKENEDFINISSYSLTNTKVVLIDKISFADGNKIGTFVENNNIISSKNNLWTLSNGTFETNNQILKPEDAYNFYAYYPYSETIGEATEMQVSVRADQSTQQNYDDSDFLFASAINNTTKNIDLNFKHQLSKIIINLKVGEGLETIPTISNISINNSQLSAKINLCSQNGDISYLDIPTIQDITMGSNGENSYKAIVVPQTIFSGNTLLTITTPNKTYKHILKSDFTIKSGNEYSLNVTMHKTGLTINNISIVDWDITTPPITDNDINRKKAFLITLPQKEYYEHTHVFKCTTLDGSIIGLICRELVDGVTRDILYVVNNKDGVKTADFSKGVIYNSLETIYWNEDGSHTIVPEEIKGSPLLRGTLFIVDGVIRTTVDDSHIFDKVVDEAYFIDDYRPQSENSSYGTTDAESFSYGIVKIGLQMWTQQNVENSKLNDGTPLYIGNGITSLPNPPIGESYLWSSWTVRNVPSCCVFGFTSRTLGYKESTVRNKYGVIYNYYAVRHPLITTNRKVNWQVPTKSQWEELLTYVTPIGTTSNISHLEKAGFKPIAGGYRDYFSKVYNKFGFDFLNQRFSWWTSTLVNPDVPEAEANYLTNKAYTVGTEGLGRTSNTPPTEGIEGNGDIKIQNIYEFNTGHYIRPVNQITNINEWNIN